MFSLSLLVFCTLLQLSDETTRPKYPERNTQSTIPRQPVQSVDPIPQTPVVSPPNDPRQLYFQCGVLAVPEYNKITLPAPERAVLMSLRTEQRDAAGNILLDNEGNPLMIHIAKGMKVFQGQVLGNFDDRELNSTLKINQAQLDVAKAELEKKIEVEYAASSLRVALKDVNRLKEGNLRTPGTFPQVEVERAELQRDQAVANLDLQKYNLQEIKPKELVVREYELERTQTQIDIRKIIAPIDGIITDVQAAEGKWLREGDTVLIIVQLSTLWAQIDVDATRYTIQDVDGKSATVTATLANGKVETFQGTVVFVDPDVLPGYTFRAYVAIQNRRIGNYWLLIPGYCKVDITIPL
ncbi:MAG: HlyD family efflux transporter periplasmic adaptor subunit [Planctomycetaceae bacterium]|jgi:multidrug efflux pump subunit AcrA (membrane-fusion protein)|nr:HlyD family efflux transporter periplasmic adaptor subunit [Planctomycetaceae bacterium]